MDDWHNGTVQGQRNTAAAKNMRKRAETEMAKWLRERKGGAAEPAKGRKLRGRRRRLIGHLGAI